ncbi:hypothetical protein L226DRAFT_283322 [Lentinus tigrinus ALCF2SS1-7]|uniref:uncharacterized protein n=1 Tax=Lentinus tigrinus ALCF2SS1-7 TaxID=1328758 RepID=UPI0011661274|nr:hypothetical protein L226DRAFT_283322 [Lentinus tigrinus ALCF2SS1-7]
MRCDKGRRGLPIAMWNLGYWSPVSTPVHTGSLVLYFVRATLAESAGNSSERRAAISLVDHTWRGSSALDARGRPASACTSSNFESCSLEGYLHARTPGSGARCTPVANRCDVAECCTQASMMGSALVWNYRTLAERRVSLATVRGPALRKACRCGVWDVGYHLAFAHVCALGGHRKCR